LTGYDILGIYWILVNIEILMFLIKYIFLLFFSGEEGEYSGVV